MHSEVFRGKIVRCLQFTFQWLSKTLYADSFGKKKKGGGRGRGRVGERGREREREGGSERERGREERGGEREIKKIVKQVL